MDVEAFRVGFAFGPGDDVGGAEQGWVGDSGQRATGLPVVEQAVAEDVLADALDGEALDFGGPGESGGLMLEDVQRRIRQAGGELVEARQHGVESGERGEHVARQAGAGDIRGGWHLPFADNAGVIDGEQPGAARAGRSQPQGATRGCGGKRGPAVALATHMALDPAPAPVEAKAMLPRRLFALLADDEALGYGGGHGLLR